MNKKKIIAKVTNAAKLYHINLENQHVIFLYGKASDIREQIKSDAEVIKGISYYEVAFHRSNFLHLTGLRANKEQVATASHFYEKCLDNRLSENDFFIAKDGSTMQKLDVIEEMMCIKRKATMIGDFSDRGSKLYAKKAAGNICACMGFIKDSHTGYNVPCSLLKKDIRQVVSKPQMKVIAVLSKSYIDEKYRIIEKCDKAIDLHNIDGMDKILEI